MDDNTPKNRGGQPRAPYDARKQKALTVAVSTGDPAAINKALCSLDTVPGRLKVTPDELELILLRIAGGETMRDVCIELGVNSAIVRQRAYDHGEFGERLRHARALGADQLFEKMLVVALDETKPVAERRLVIEVMEKMAKVHNRGLYGDKVAVDVRAVQINLTPDDRDLT